MQRRSLHVLVLAGAMTWAAGCVSHPVVLGNIPPETFQFTTVVKHTGRRPGGWQVAQVLVIDCLFSPDHL